MSDTASPGYTRAVQREGKVPVVTKIFQGVGGIANSHKDFAFNTFLLLFYSQIMGLPASLVSIAIAAAVIIDAISDPVVGSISDNFKSKLGRRHPFMFAAALPFGVSLYLLFDPPGWLTGYALLAWMFVFVVLARTTWTFLAIPWHALAAEFSNDYVERTSIITYRYMVGWVGGVIFYLFTWNYLFPNTEAYPAGQLNPENYPLFAVIVGSLVVVWIFLSTFGTRNQVPYLLQPTEPTPPFSFGRALNDVRMALQSANLKRLFFLFLLFSGLAGVGGVFDIYMNTYFWGLTPDELRWFVLLGLGAILSFITVPLLQRKFDKQFLLQYFLGTYMVLAILKVSLRFLDILPPNGEPALLYFLVCHGIVGTYLLTTCGIVVGSLMADLIDEQELETHKRQEGVFSSAIGFATKATSSFGIVIGGFILDFFVVFPRQAGLDAVDADTLFRLGFADGIAIPLLFMIPIYLMSQITMTRERLAEVQRTLEQRRGFK